MSTIALIRRDDLSRRTVFAGAECVETNKIASPLGP